MEMRCFLRGRANFIFPMVQKHLVGQGLLIFKDSRSHSATSHSVGLLWTSYQSNAQTSTWREKKHMPPAGFEPAISSKRGAADARLKPRGHCDRHNLNTCITLHNFTSPYKEYKKLTLILRRSRTGTVWFYTSTSNKRVARPKLYTVINKGLKAYV